MLLTQIQIVGNNKLTENEERLHFGLWAIAKSPLILGNDLNKISSASLAIIKNKVSHCASLLNHTSN